MAKRTLDIRFEAEITDDLTFGDFISQILRRHADELDAFNGGVLLNGVPPRDIGATGRLEYEHGGAEAIVTWKATCDGE